MGGIKNIIKDLGIVKVKVYRKTGSNRYRKKIYFLGIKIYSGKGIYPH